MCLCNRTLLAAALLSALLFAGVGCRRLVDHQIDSEQFHLRGLVLGKSTMMNELSVRDDEASGFLPQMTEVYKIKDPAFLRELQPGDQIAADVQMPADSNDYLLVNTVITGQPRHNPSAMLPPHQLLIGEEAPDIPLVNQDGKTIDLRNYRGKAVLITFIDTQCTEDCPLLTSRFLKINRLLAKEPKAYAASRLISISIDPDNDKPPVLRKYGLRYLGNNPSALAHWEFAVTTPANLKRLAQAFGVVYRKGGDDIIHNMVTALIGPDNELIQTWDGDGWNANNVARAVEAAADGSMKQSMTGE